MRLFVAVNLAEHLRRAIWDTAAPLRDVGLPVKWVAPESLHVTLKFLGDVEPAREAELRAILDAAVDGAKPFSMGIGEFGAFPTTKRPRVVWVGCEGVPALELLQHRLEHELAGVGFPLEGRPFRPHITLGRAKREARAGAFVAFEATLAGLEYFGETLVESLDLMESELSPRGARYRVRYRAELAAP